MPNPRVIFVNRVYWPSSAATAQLLTDLAEGLAARDWPVQVIATGTGPGAHRGVTIQRTGAGEAHDGLVSQVANYGRFLRRARRELSTLVRPDDVVVLMTDPPMLGAGATGIVQRRGGAVVHWIQDIHPEIVTAHVGALAGLPLWPLQRKRDAAWRSARCCVTLGENMARTVAERGVPDARIAVLGLAYKEDTHSVKNSPSLALLAHLPDVEPKPPSPPTSPLRH